MGDLHPAGGGLLVGERGGPDRGQRAVEGVAERGDRSGAGAYVMGVGHEQLAGVGRPELAAERAQALGRERRAGGGGQPAVEADSEAVDHRGAHLGAGQLGAGAVEQHVSGRGVGGQRDSRPGDREQAAAQAEQEAGVVGVAGTGVGHVHQGAVHGDAVGQGAAGAGDADQAERAVEADPQHGDLVAARVDGDQEPAVRGDLDRALRGQPGAGPGAAGRERRPGHGGQRAVGVPVKRPDRIGSLRVVVEVDVPDHGGGTG